MASADNHLTGAETEESWAGQDQPPKSSKAASELAFVVDRLTAIDDQLTQFNERSRHREEIIDRLHAENQELRAGERRSILDPVITDLIRLHDQIERESASLLEQGEARLGDLLASLSDDALLALERIGVERFTADVGQEFQPELHRPLLAIDDTDPSRANTLARAVASGFRDGESGRIRRKAHVHVYRYNNNSAADQREQN